MMTSRETETVARLRALMTSSTYANEKANAYARICRITAAAAARATMASVYARMGTAPATSTFTAWL